MNIRRPTILSADVVKKKTFSADIIFIIILLCIYSFIHPLLSACPYYSRYHFWVSRHLRVYSARRRRSAEAAYAWARVLPRRADQPSGELEHPRTPVTRSVPCRIAPSPLSPVPTHLAYCFKPSVTFSLISLIVIVGLASATVIVVIFRTMLQGCVEALHLWNCSPCTEYSSKSHLREISKSREPSSILHQSRLGI